MSKIIPGLATNQRSRDKIRADERTKEWSNLRSAPVQKRENPGNKSESHSGRRGWTFKSGAKRFWRANRCAWYTILFCRSRGAAWAWALVGEGRLGQPGC